MEHVRIWKNKENYELIFKTLESYDDFEIILNNFQSWFNAKVLEQVKGPDARYAFVKIEKNTLKLWNDPYGNTLYGSADDLPVLEKIANDFEKNLSEKMKAETKSENKTNKRKFKL